MIWIETVCDRCYKQCTGMDYRQGCVSKLKEETKSYDWKFVKGELYCPQCQEEMKKEREKKQ